MMRSMYSGVSGLRNHQIRMDAIGNNIANVNTFGFKSNRVSFQDALNQTFRGAAAPAADGTRGGINAMQIGLGMNVASVDVLHTQGNMQNTGVITDCAIQGDGFFILSDGMRDWYTRAGNFKMDSDGDFVNASNGLMVRGWMADNVGAINTNTPVTNIQIPVGQTIAPVATTEIDFGGNMHPDINGELTYPDITVTDTTIPIPLSCQIQVTITPIGFNQYTWTVTSPTGAIGGVANGTITLNAAGAVTANTSLVNFTVTPPGSLLPVNVQPPQLLAPNGGTFITQVPAPIVTSQGVFNPVQPLVNTTRVYDSLGVDHTITTTITKIGVNAWSWASVNELGAAVGNGNLTFDTSGRYTGMTGGPITWLPLGAQVISIIPDFSGIRQNAERPLTEVYISPTEVTSPFQDGFPAGSLQGYNIDNSGIIKGVFSNGRNLNLAQIAMANFTNPGGLTRAGDTMFEESNNSGPAQIGVAGRNGRGLVTPGAIEMSNVDLSAEFTDMIVTERGFQSNSRIITTSDEMLQELVNLKR